MELSVSIGNSVLPNPVGVASGTFGYGSEYEQLVDSSRLGAIYTKAVTIEPRSGNAIPRIVETAAGLLNSIGLANVGLETFRTEKMVWLRKQNCAVVVNVAGASTEEYLAIVDALEPVEGIWGYEINLSCPNVKAGCLAFGTDPGNVEKLTTRLRCRTKRPLIIKLTPNVTDIEIIAAAAEQGGADAVSCINTLVGMAIDIERRRPVLPAGTGGLSGPAIKPVGVAAVYRVSRRISIPVIGIGGIMNWQDAVEYLLAGASAIQVGTGLFTDPSIPEKVLLGIQDYAGKHGFHTTSEFRLS